MPEQTFKAEPRYCEGCGALLGYDLTIDGIPSGILAGGYIFPGLPHGAHCANPDCGKHDFYNVQLEKWLRIMEQTGHDVSVFTRPCAGHSTKG